MHADGTFNGLAAADREETVSAEKRIEKATKNVETTTARVIITGGDRLSDGKTLPADEFKASVPKNRTRRSRRYARVLKNSL